MNIHALAIATVLALAVAALSLTITKAAVFKDLREWVNGRNEWLGKLVSCPYCTSHWVSFILVGIYRPVIVQSAVWPVNLAVSAFVIVGLAAPMSWVIYCSFTKLYEPENEEAQALRAALEKAKEKLVEQARQIKTLSAAGQ